MRLNTLDRPHIVHSTGEEVELQPLAVAVLAYLAVGGPRNRQHLAEMFWRNSKNGLNSLSTTLNRIRAQVPGGVWVRGHTLVGTDLTCDVNQLRQSIDRSDFEAVTQLYTGPFLDNLRLRQQSVEFEEWVLDQRTTLASMAEMSLLRRGRQCHAAGERLAAATAAEQAWQITVRDGFPSTDYFDTYHKLMTTAGRPSARAVRKMADECGIELLSIDVPPVDPMPSDQQQEMWDLQRTTLRSLRRLFTESGQIGDGRALFLRTTNVLRSNPNSPEDLLVMSLEALAWFQLLSGEATQARSTPTKQSD